MKALPAQKNPPAQPPPGPSKDKTAPGLLVGYSVPPASTQVHTPQSIEESQAWARAALGNHDELMGQQEKVQEVARIDIPGEVLEVEAAVFTGHGQTLDGQTEDDDIALPHG